jgi:dUTP pyrophosphatase
MKDVKLGGGLQFSSNEVNVKIKKTSQFAIIPQYQSEQAAGFDFHAAEETTIMPGETALIDTGLSFEIPPQYELQIRPRSGLSAKTGIRVSNSPGTVDADFRGSVKVILHNTGTTPFRVNLNDRIAQGVIAPVYRAVFEVTEELSETQRGDSGFGSSGV